MHEHGGQEKLDVHWPGGIIPMNLPNHLLHDDSYGRILNDVETVNLFFMRLPIVHLMKDKNVP